MRTRKKQGLWEVAGLRGGSSLRKKHSRGLTQSVQTPRLLIGQMFGWRGSGGKEQGVGWVGGRMECVGDAYKFCWRAQGWVVRTYTMCVWVRVCVRVCAHSHHTLPGLCCYPVKDEGPDSLHVTVNFGSVRTADWTCAVSLCDKQNGHIQVCHILLSFTWCPPLIVENKPLTFNHLSTHFAWNSWLQGNTRSSCLDSKSLKHTTHLKEKRGWHHWSERAEVQ